MSEQTPGERTAFSLGLCTVALLPAWDAVTSLPASDRTWIPLAWVLGATLVMSAALFVGLMKQRMSPSLRWLLLVPLATLLALMVFDTGSFLYAHVKSLIVIYAGAYYGVARLAALVAIPLTALALLTWCWRKGWRPLVHTAQRMLALLAALPLVFTISYLLGTGLKFEAGAVDPPAKHVTVLLILDELDANVIDRRIDRLPNLRRLRNTALTASAMYPPANYTSESLPGMLTGVDFEFASYTRGEIHVLPAGQTHWERLSRQTSIFSDASRKGQRVDIVGWHLPYCSVFSGLQSCWDDAAFLAPGQYVPLHDWLRGHSRVLGALDQWRLDRLKGNVREYSRAFFSAPVNYRLRRIGEIFEQQSARLLQILKRGRSELVFAHLACPHPPSLHREDVDRLDIFEAYERNIESCDRLLGDVEQSLEQLGLLDGYNLIVTSDHWFRGLDWLAAGSPLVVPSERRTVPFYVKIDRRNGTTHSTSSVTNTRVLRAVLGSLADGRADYSKIRSVIEAHGDGATRLRAF
jgi:Sulfatase